MASGEYDMMVSYRILKEVFLADLISIFLELEDDLCTAEVLFVLICYKFRFSTEESRQIARYLEYCGISRRYFTVDCNSYS